MCYAETLDPNNQLIKGIKQQRLDFLNGKNILENKKQES